MRSITRITTLVLMAPTLLFAAPKEVSQEDIAIIQKNLPEAIKPKKKHNVLCFSKPFGFYHSSIKIAKEMVKAMGSKTGLFDVTLTDDINDLTAENLANYDTIYFNNTAHIHKGITDEATRSAITNFVKNGGGFVAIHAATDGGWPEYIDMVGGTFDGHPWGKDGTYPIANEDPLSPITQGICENEKSFNLNDELYQYKEFNRDDVRVLLSVDMSKYRNHIGGRKREDNDYALMWVKDYGKGKVFVSSLGHNEHIYQDKDVLKMWYDGFRFTLGELDVDTNSKVKAAYALPPKAGSIHPDAAFRSEEESMKEFEIQDGYSLELVAGDDMLNEPAINVWDGNGRMYVAEWSTYMQDIAGTGTNDATSNVLRLEDTDGDGIMDKRVVFAENICLPRMILPLKDSVLIAETNTSDIYEYFDEDGDGKSDRKELWYEGGKRGGNVEHQPSGLIWSLDNWIYSTYNGYRFRIQDGKVMKGDTKGNRGQWGLTQDNQGKVIFVDAGAGIGPVHTQFPNVYTKWHPKWTQAEGFRTVYPIDNIADSQGGRGSMREDNSAKSFTATCGQAIFRGDRLPKDLQGHLIFSEPVGRVVRRAEFKKDAMGRKILHNIYQDREKEWIASTDANFRMVNSATGPDGTLYIVDIHRGIVQESQWVPKGSYIFNAIKFYGLDQNIGRGRINRVRHSDFKPGPKPNMLDETPMQLVAHLSHPNGWWRDEAQKLIVLSGDKSVIPALQDILSSGDSPLGRLHALWTIEGLGAIDEKTLANAMQDSDPSIRAAAIRIYEPFFIADMTKLANLEPMISDSDVDVKLQLLLSMSVKVTDETRAFATKVVNSDVANVYLKEVDEALNEDYFKEVERQKKLASLAKEERELMDTGSTHYAALCASCHGVDGNGMDVGHGQKMAPSFIQSPTVLGDHGVLTRIALHGMTGPIRGKTYTGGVMMPLKSNDDKYLASVLTFIRKSWGNKAEIVKPSDVAKVREETKDVNTPYTEIGLRDLTLNSGGNIKGWKLDSSHGQKKLVNLQSDEEEMRWATNSAISDKTWIAAEFPHDRRVFKVILDARGDDFPTKLKVEVSTDGKEWKTVANNVEGKRKTSITFDMVVARKVRISSLTAKNKWWQLEDLQIIGPGMGDIDQFPVAKRVFISHKDAKEFKIGWGQPKPNKGIRGGAIKIAGVKYDKGMGLHAVTEAVYDITGKGYQTFFAHVGHADSGSKDHALTNQVYLDGKLAYNSGDMKQGDPAKAIELDVSNANEVKIVVNPGSDGKPGGDHADWGNACFIKK